MAMELKLRNEMSEIINIASFVFYRNDIIRELTDKYI